MNAADEIRGIFTGSAARANYVRDAITVDAHKRGAAKHEAERGSIVQKIPAGHDVPPLGCAEVSANWSAIPFR
jgi:hypothetical protein